MKRLLSAELLKLRLTPTVWWISGFSLLLPTVIMLVFKVSDVHTGKDVASLLGWAGISGYFTLLLGAVFATAEFTHKTIVPTLLATPQRMKVITAQLVALILWSVGIALVSIAIVTILTIVRTGLHDISLSLLLGSYLGSVAYIVLSALLGMGIGILTKNQVATVGAILVWFAGVDPALSALFPELGKYTIASIGISLSGGLPSEGGGPYQLLLGPVAAGLVYLAYAAIPLAIGLVRFRRSDIA